VLPVFEIHDRSGVKASIHRESFDADTQKVPGGTAALTGEWNRLGQKVSPVLLAPASVSIPFSIRRRMAPDRDKPSALA
jgi:hypothetical protein